MKTQLDMTVISAAKDALLEAEISLSQLVRMFDSAATDYVIQKTAEQTEYAFKNVAQHSEAVVKMVRPMIP